MIYCAEYKPENIDYKFLDRVVLFAFDYLELPEDLYVEIIFDYEEDDPKYCGSSDLVDGVLTIWVNPVLQEQDVIVTIFHEFVHIRQLVNKQLVVGDGPDNVKWMGELVTDTYMNLPWEVEAYKLEEEMLKEFGEIK